MRSILLTIVVLLSVFVPMLVHADGTAPFSASGSWSVSGSGFTWQNSLTFSGGDFSGFATNGINPPWLTTPLIPGQTYLFDSYFGGGASPSYATCPPINTCPLNNASATYQGVDYAFGPSSTFPNTLSWAAVTRFGPHGGNGGFGGYINIPVGTTAPSIAFTMPYQVSAFWSLYQATTTGSLPPYSLALVHTFYFSGEGTLDFTAVRNGDGTYSIGNSLNVSLTGTGFIAPPVPAPEPSTWLMVGTGLLGFLSYRWYRQRRISVDGIHGKACM